MACDWEQRALTTADEGLQSDGTELSQIPTYVTAVPNGTEKVWSIDEHIRADI